MNGKFPRPRELAAFAVLAVVCAAVATLIGKDGMGLAVMGAPIFLVGAIMGLRRSGEIAAAGNGEEADSDDSAC